MTASPIVSILRASPGPDVVVTPRWPPYEAPSEATLFTFLRRLRAQGIFVKRRITYGRDLMGACGQLGNPELRHTRPAVRAAGGTRG